jgi:hypothetical protein
MPTGRLVGIAVEGLAPADQASASAETVEIADLVLYYGKGPTFFEASSVVIVQLKYSKGSQSVPYRVSDAKKTIQKFAAALVGIVVFIITSVRRISIPKVRIRHWQRPRHTVPLKGHC